MKSRWRVDRLRLMGWFIGNKKYPPYYIHKDGIVRNSMRKNGIFQYCKTRKEAREILKSVSKDYLLGVELQLESGTYEAQN